MELCARLEGLSLRSTFRESSCIHGGNDAMRPWLQTCWIYESCHTGTDLRTGRESEKLNALHESEPGVYYAFKF
jgi:hypothetical protein